MKRMLPDPSLFFFLFLFYIEIIVSSLYRKSSALGVMDSLDALNADIKKKAEELKKKDISELDKLTLKDEIKVLKKQRDKVAKEEIIPPLVENTVLPTQEDVKKVDLSRPEVHQPKLDKSAQFMAYGLNTIMKVVSQSVPYCENCEKSVPMDDLVNVCNAVIEDIKSRNIDPSKVMNPYVLLGTIVFGGVAMTAAANYEKKTGKNILGSMISSGSSPSSSTQSNGASTQSVTSGSSQPSLSTPSLPSH